jgi:hypothetical protein
MERDIAVRIDGMLMNVIGAIDGIANYMKNNLSEEEYKSYIYNIGAAMGNLVDISSDLHKQHDGITPKELRPQS